MSTYIFSDLHGNYKIWNKIKNFVKPDDILYCLGDCIDKGKGGIAILKEVMKDPRLQNHVIIGNHEHFLWYNMTFHDRDYFEIWQDPQNGGEYTFNAWKHLKQEEKDDILDFISNLPAEITIQNKKGETLILNHSGYCADYSSPHHNLDNPYLWDRYQLWNQLRGDDNFFNSEEWKHKYIIHGHTPNIAIDDYMSYYFLGKKDYSKEVIQYCHRHKIDLDLGTFITKMAVLFDVDTFDAYYFNESSSCPAPFKIERLKRC